MFLPSLLEYSAQNLQQKLDLIQTNFAKFQTLTKQKNPDQINFHLDFVLPVFAKEREVKPSLDLKTVLTKLSQTFSQKLKLSIHLMGLETDLAECNNFFEKYSLPKNFLVEIYLPQQQFYTWKYPVFENFNSTKNCKLGLWLDLNQWQEFDLSEFSQKHSVQNFLLMTVLAGKSGQKLTTEIQSQVLSIAQKYQNYHFILDGGWQIEFESNLKNLEIVSYSSFWKQF